MARVIAVGIGVLALCAVGLATPFPGCQGGTLQGCPGTPNCTTKYIEQNVDHFNWAPPLNNPKMMTYKMRWFDNQQWWATNKDGTRGPVFFYFGNEDNVELYVNHTGLMWESAAQFGARLVFAEHRYYGESMPFPAGVEGCMNWLTSEQAMADFAYLIDQIRHEDGASKSPFIGFGGSYGGMIGAWFRVHYPNAIDGVVAASAPIWSFVGLDPPYNPNAFDATVTVDASLGQCATQLESAWPKILAAGATDAGRKTLQAAFHTCAPLRPKGPDKEGRTIDDALSIVQWAQGIWGIIAMGDYPYPSSYLLHGKSLLPAWPVKSACLPLEFPLGSDDELFNAVRTMASVVYNNTYDQPCFNITGQPAPNSAESVALEHVATAPDPTRLSARRHMRPPLLWHRHGDGDGNGDGEALSAAQCQGSWGYQWCTEMTQPFTEGTDEDMFYCPKGTFYPAQNCSHWDIAGQARGCQDDWGVTPRPEWARVALGGKRIQDATNIVFSNGDLDPWHNGGVLTDLSDSVVAIRIPNGAHHIDLMFTDPADAAYADIPAARDTERQHMKKWVVQAYANHGVEGLVPDV